MIEQLHETLALFEHELTNPDMPQMGRKAMEAAVKTYKAAIAKLETEVN